MAENMEHKIGALTRNPDGGHKWEIRYFSSLPVDGLGYCSPSFTCAGGHWYLCFRRVSSQRGTNRRIELQLCRYRGVPPTLNVEYAFSVKDRNGHRHGEQRNRKVFRGGDVSPLIPIELEGTRMREWVPGDRLTILCHLEGINLTQEAGSTAFGAKPATNNVFGASVGVSIGFFGAASQPTGSGLFGQLSTTLGTPASTSTGTFRGFGTTTSGNLFSSSTQSSGGLFGSTTSEVGAPRPTFGGFGATNPGLFGQDTNTESNLFGSSDAAQLKEKLPQQTAELAEKQSELVQLRRLNEELNLKVTDIEADRDNLLKLLETKKAAELKELVSFRRELAENRCELVRLRRLNEELNRKVTDLEANRDNAQKLLETENEDCDSGSSTLLRKNKVLRDLKDLFLKRKECDLVLKVKGHEFPVHRIILMARSPVLASTFQCNMKEKATGVVEIEDCDPASFSNFLCYLYCGAVENLSSENVFSLFTMADKYNLQDLRSECLEFLKGNLSVKTFCDTITLALRHSETELLCLTRNFFTQHAPKIILTAKWQQFSADNRTESKKLLIKHLVTNKNSNS